MGAIDDLRAKVNARRITVKVLLNLELLDEHARLEVELSKTAMDDAMHNRPSQAGDIARQIEELEARMGEEEDAFVFGGVGTTVWYELVAQHPPSAEDRKTGADHDWRTFRPAAIAASCVDPVLTVDDAVWLMSVMPLSQWEMLWRACMEANVGTDARPKSLLASTVLRLNSRSPGSSGPEGSLAEPSSVGPGDLSPPASTTTPDV